MFKMSLNFICLAVFYVIPLMSAEIADPAITSVESIHEELLQNIGRGGSTAEQINGLSRQLNEVYNENLRLKEEIKLLNQKITLLEIGKTPWNPAMRLKGAKEGESSVSFNCSPSDKQSLIYMMYIADGDNQSLIPVPQRLDATKLKVGPINEANLFKASLEIEKHLLKIIQKNPHFVHRTIYVGLTKGTLKDRFRGHFADSQDEVKKKSSNKVIHIERALELLFNVKVSYLIANVPERYLDYFECLVSDLFLAQENGGSARIATRQAWEKYLEYKNSSTRIDYLTQKNLINVVKNIAKNLFHRKINFSPIELEQGDQQVPSSLYSRAF